MKLMEVVEMQNIY